LPGIPSAQIVLGSHEDQLFQAGQGFPDHKFLWAKSDPMPKGPDTLLKQLAIDSDFPAICLEKSTDHSDGGGFSGAVRAQESENLSPVDVQGEVAYCLKVSERFSEIREAQNDVSVG